MNLNKRETATVLAALRFFQANFDSIKQMKEEMSRHFYKLRPLNHDEIDELYEEINCFCNDVPQLIKNRIKRTKYQIAVRTHPTGEEFFDSETLSTLAEDVLNKVNEIDDDRGCWAMSHPYVRVATVNLVEI